MLVAGTRSSKHSQHVPHCLSRLRLNAVEQFSGAIGAELATDIERPGSGCDHALRERRVLWSSSGSTCVVLAVLMSFTLEVAADDSSDRERQHAYRVGAYRRNRCMM
jgi:hypothetical protein